MNQSIRQDAIILIGKNIRQVRMEKNITQDEVTAKLQLKGLPISIAIYSKIEMGARHIEASYLEAIRDVLKTTYERLLAHTDEAWNSDRY